MFNPKTDKPNLVELSNNFKDLMELINEEVADKKEIRQIFIEKMISFASLDLNSVLTEVKKLINQYTPSLLEQENFQRRLSNLEHSCQVMLSATEFMTPRKTVDSAKEFLDTIEDSDLMKNMQRCNFIKSFCFSHGWNDTSLNYYLLAMFIIDGYSKEEITEIYSRLKINTCIFDYNNDIKSTMIDPMLHPEITKSLQTMFDAACYALLKAEPWEQESYSGNPEFGKLVDEYLSQKYQKDIDVNKILLNSDMIR